MAALLTACGGGGGSHEDVPPDGDGGFVADRDANDPTGDSAPTDGDAAVDAGYDAAPPAVLVPRPKETADFGWKSCADGLQCGSLHVPIDYDNAYAGTLKLAVMRRLATGTRSGALLIDPGGPGASAIDYLGYWVQDNDTPLLDRFDVVAVDPRGVGYSTGVTCHSTLQQLSAADPEPADDAAWQALDAMYKAFDDECANAPNANLLPFVGTPNVARDMDQVRAALGEEKTNYLGFSYGTAIGAWYAQEFPTKVGHMVLDGALDLGLSAFDRTLQQAKGFELAFSHYFDWCNEVASRCGSWTKGADPAATFAQLKAQVRMTPIPAKSADRPLQIGDLLLAVTAPLYGGLDGWRALSRALGDAVNGDASTLIGFVDDYYFRNADGSYPNFQEMFTAVSCIDQYAPTVAEIRAQEARFRSEAPTFGMFSLTTMLACSHWPVQGVDVPVPTGQGAPPLVVVGTLNDPATPYAWAQAFAKDMVSATLLTSDLEGHTAYDRGDPCIDGAVNTFLFDGTVPTVDCSMSAAGATNKGRTERVTPLESRWMRRRH